MDKDVLIKYWIDFLPYVWNDDENIYNCQRKYLTHNNLKYIKEFRNNISDCFTIPKNFFDICKIILLDDEDYLEKIKSKDLRIKLNGQFIEINSFYNFIFFFSKIMNLKGNFISKENISNSLFEKVNVFDLELTTPLDVDVNVDPFKYLQVPKLKNKYYRIYSKDEIFDKFYVYRYVILSTRLTQKYRIVFPELLEKCSELSKFPDSTFRLSNFYYRIRLKTRRIIIKHSNISKSLIYYINRFGNICLKVNIQNCDLTILIIKKVRSVFCICDSRLLYKLELFEVQMNDVIREIFLNNTSMNDYYFNFYRSFTLYEPKYFEDNIQFLELLKDIEDNYTDDILTYYSISNKYRNRFWKYIKQLLSIDISDYIIKYDWKLWFVEMIILNLDRMNKTFYKDFCKNIVYTILNDQDIIHYITHLLDYISLDFLKYSSNFTEDGLKINQEDVKKICDILCKNI